MNTRETGARGEEKSIEFLKKQGYEIIERNFFSRHGEIDIIAKDKSKDLIFIEVKSRSSLSYGFPQEAVNGPKQKKIIKSALDYIKQKGLFGENVRFDVVVLGPQNENIEVIKSAFMAQGRYTY